MICLTKSRSEFLIVSGFLLFWHVHGFFSFNRELSKLGSSLLAINTFKSVKV